MEPTSTEAPAVALGQIRAAQAILVEPACEPALAVIHLEAAWRALLDLAESDELSASLRGADLPGLDAEVRDRLAGEVSQLRTRSRRELQRHARELAAAAGGVDREARGDRRRAEALRRWGGRGAAIAGVLVVLIGMWLVTRANARPVRWRGAYFAKADFSGPAIAHDDTVLDFDWADDPPIRGIGRDGFSIRWDSCLVLDSARTVGWQLVSNDGSRLFVDGELVVDNWEHKGDKPGGRDQALTAGVHALRVEYRELKGAARVTLLASLDGAAPSVIAGSWLRYPDGDDSAPCRGVAP